MKNHKIESEKCFVSDTIVSGFNEAKEGKFAGEIDAGLGATDKGQGRICQ